MQISDAEWQVMRVVWAKHQVTSKVIVASLEQKFGWSASTVKTLLGRLVDKGALVTQRQGRGFLYRSALSEQAIYRAELEAVLGKICQRKHLGLLKETLTQLPMTAQDIAGLEALLLTKKESAVDRVPCNCLPGQCACAVEES